MITMTKLTNIPEHEVLKNTRYKYVTIDGVEKLVETLWFDRPKFNPEKVVSTDNITKFRNITKNGNKNENNNRLRSIKRARQNAFDYVLCTPSLDTFVTLTLDKNVINRYNYDVIIKKFNTWLDNCVRRKGLCYVLVPEYHKDGAIHFHGFMNSVCLDLVDSGVQKNGQLIYNLGIYSFGFSTGIVLDNSPCVRLKVAKYIWKYINKNVTSNTIGGRYYLHGGKLNRPRFEYDNLLCDEVSGETFSVGGCVVKLSREIL